MSMTRLILFTRNDEKTMILNNRGIRIRQVTDDLGISFSSCKAILSNVLGMKTAAILSENKVA